MSSPSAGALLRRQVRQVVTLDIRQFVDPVATEVGLGDELKAKLKKFAKLSPVEQQLWLAARLISIDARTDKLEAPEAAFDIPSRMLNKIEKLILVVLVSPKISAYLNDVAVNMIMVYLAKHPSLGLTKEVGQDKTKCSVITSRVRLRLGQRRNQVKALIAASLGTPTDVALAPDQLQTRNDAQDIVALCDSIVNLAKKHVTIELSLPLAARVAFLRSVYLHKRGTNEDVEPSDVKKYWESVDGKLKSMREDKKDDAERISRCFGRYLKTDRKIYGTDELAYKSMSLTAEDLMDDDA